MSRHEVRSSWSSSEEALEACEGLVFNVALEGSTRCVAEADEGSLWDVSAHVCCYTTWVPNQYWYR